jgi:archaellum component FlaC
MSYFFNIISGLIKSTTTNTNQEKETKEIVPVGQHLTFTINGQAVPEEITVYIFGFLSDEALAVAGQVCRHWSQIVNGELGEILWKHLASEKAFIKEPSDIDSYRDFYRKTTKQEYYSLINKSILPSLIFNSEIPVRNEEMYHCEIKQKEKRIQAIEKKAERIKEELTKEKVLDSPVEIVNHAAIFLMFQSLIDQHQFNTLEIGHLNNLLSWKRTEIAQELKVHHKKTAKIEKKLEGTQKEIENLREECNVLENKKNPFRADLKKEFQGTSLFSIETQQKMLDLLNSTASKLPRKYSGLLSVISSWLKNDPELLFLIVSHSGAVFFLKNLVKEGKAIVPTQEVCKWAFMDPLLRAVKDKNHAMLEYL